MSFALLSFYVIESVSYIIKISVESRALLSCYDLVKLERIKRNKRVHIDLMNSNDFTYKEYEA